MPPDVKASLRLIRPSVRQLKKEAAKAAVQKYQEVPLSKVCCLDPLTNHPPGCLPPALRNFIVSHSTEGFERSCQPARLRANPANVAFGDKARHDAALWEAISNTLHPRDPNAPTRLSKEELD